VKRKKKREGKEAGRLICIINRSKPKEHTGCWVKGSKREKEQQGTEDEGEEGCSRRRVGVGKEKEHVGGAKKKQKKR
jgi:hypothetical protein